MKLAPGERQISSLPKAIHKLFNLKEKLIFLSKVKILGQRKSVYLPHCYPTVHHPTLHYSLSHVIPSYRPVYPLRTFYTPRFPSIYILLHSTLSYSSIPYPKLLHYIPTETDQNDPGPKRRRTEKTSLFRPNRPTIRW